MGLRKYYILYQDNKLFTGPKAYQRLLTEYRTYLTWCQQRLKKPELQLPTVTGNWRKKIVLLYKELDKFYGYPKNTLRVTTLRRGRSDYEYARTLKALGIQRQPQAKTPRQELK